ncbi:uncharacterized protein LOC130690327 [Daphnia carinata]|uniref:uncharacterized protein LOC130690327 n=1 Tax=Daphnia carinata TaxID=120202 RepID=UPI0025803326|nr:uncharacterized protein LOC130690327 [Daphnia carinata]XP_057369319.1 uncharacterized protein LOC130690327 [Daphnia carinata]
MEFVFLLLSAVFAVSQQFHHQIGHHWHTSRFPLPSVANNRPPIYYDYLQASRHFVPTNRHYADINELYPSFVTVDFINGHEFVDVNSRIKGSNGRRPLAHQQMHEPRFFFGKIAGLYSDRFTKTAVFTVTSSVTLTTIQSCVAAINVFDTGKTTFCRRKRDDMDNAEGNQFDINPSQPEEVISTALPLLDLTLDDYSFGNDALSSANVGNDYTFDDVTTSSNNLIQDSSIGQVPTSTTMWWKKLRGKLFFDYSLTSITVTSYSFYSITVTKTVAIAGESEVMCLPSDWVVCY